MRPQLAREARFIDMFNREGKLAMMLKNRCIVETLEIGQHDGRHYIAMEYIGGRDLTQVLRRCQETQQRIPVPHAVYIAARIAEGLHFAHTLHGPDGRPLNIVNRDVSPSNVRMSLRRRRQAARLRHRPGADEVHQRDRHPQGQVQLHVARSRSAACRSTRAPTCSPPASSSTRC